MIGCLLAPEPPEEALRALRVALGRLSPRVQLARGAPPGALELALDLGRGTLADGRRHAAAIAAAAAGLAAGRIGVAPAPTLARLAAATAAPGAPALVPPGAVAALLARCPPEALPPLAPHAAALRALGMRSLADVAALPAAAVGGRLGGAALVAWQALRGDEPPLAPLPEPPLLRARRGFAGPVADAAALEAALARLVARLAGGLERRGSQARALALLLHTDDGRSLSAGRPLERPAASAAALGPIALGLLRAAGLDSGAEALELTAGELVGLRGEQLGLFGAAGGPAAEARAALDDLAARMGPGRLLRAAPAPPGVAPALERARLGPWGPR